MIFNHNKRNIVAKGREKRRGIVISKIKDKPKLRKNHKLDNSQIVMEAKKNKQEMEALLATHGGNFKTDFGLSGTIDFGEENNKQGWNRLLGYMQVHRFNSLARATFRMSE